MPFGYQIWSGEPLKDNAGSKVTQRSSMVDNKSKDPDQIFRHWCGKCHAGIIPGRSEVTFLNVTLVLQMLLYQHKNQCQSRERTPI